MNAAGTASGHRDAPVVSVSNEQTAVTIDVERWHTVAEAVLRVAVDTAAVEMAVMFVDVETIAALNEQYLGVDGPTDVLSFPLDEPGEARDGSGPPVLLGDVVICPEIALANAPRHAGSLDDEIALLLVHGILHLLGHDHAEDDEAALMRQRQTELLEGCFWRGPTPAGFSHDHLD